MSIENSFSHLNNKGEAFMIDVANRELTLRISRVSGTVKLSSDVVSALRDNSIPKGDVIGTARVAAIMGAKKTSDLIPMSHPLAIHGIVMDFEITDSGVDVTAEVKTVDRTGVEMEAFTAVAVACLTIIDMTKSMDPHGVISEIKLISKSGGRNGVWERDLS